MATNALGDPTAFTPPEKDDGDRSYYLTRWAFVNDSLAVVDRVTGGKAGWLQRFVTYFFAGGSAAVVNLIVYFILFHLVFTGFNDQNVTQAWIHKAAAWIPATEISILANFFPNDYLTFRHMPGHNRHITARLLRFHLTCLSGTVLTAIIFSLLSLIIRPFFAQAAALALVFLYNFTVHHIFTYRHKEVTH